MNYLVTGASGFIGRRLCERLHAQGHCVRALLHREGSGPWDDSFVCDLSYPSLPDGLVVDIDGVFHLAGVAHTSLSDEEQWLYQAVNVDGTQRLLDVAISAGVTRFVYFSSVKAAADAGSVRVDERWQKMPLTEYGMSKRRAEELVLKAGSGYGMHVSVLRPALVYGPGVRGNLARMLNAVSRKKFPPLPDFGDHRSMVSLDDLVDAAFLVMDRSEAADQVYVVADGIDYSTVQLYEAMCEALGRSVPKWRVPGIVWTATAFFGDVLTKILSGRSVPFNSMTLSKMSESALYNASKLGDELGWAPLQDFYSVLPEMLKSGEDRTAYSNP